MAKKDHSKALEMLEALDERTKSDIDDCAFSVEDIVTPRAESRRWYNHRGEPFRVINEGLTKNQLEFAAYHAEPGEMPTMRVAFLAPYDKEHYDRAWVECADFEYWDADYDYAGEEDKAAPGEGTWKSPSHPSQLAKVGDHIKVEGDPDVPNGIHEVTEVDEHDDWLRVSAASHGWVQSASVKAII